MSAGAEREARGVGMGLLTLLAQASMPAFHVLLIRGLGDAQYGLYAWSIMAVEVLSVVTLLGMDTAVTREASVAVREGDMARVERAVAQGLRVVLLSGAVVSAALYVLAPLIARWAGKPGVTEPMRALIAMPVAYHAASMFLVATGARLAMQYEFWARGVFQPLVLLGATALALHLGGGVVGACAAVALGMSLTAALSGGLYGRVFSLRATLRSLLTAPFDRALLALALPYVAMNLVGALRGRIDAFWLLRYGTAEDVGAFKACDLYAFALFQVRGAFYPVVAARLPALLVAGDRAEMNAFLQRQVRWIALLATPLFVLFAALGDGLLAVFSERFARAAVPLAILSFGHFVSALSLPVYALPFSGNTRYTILSACVAIGLQLVVPRALIPRYGLEGAAVSFTIALVTAELIALAFARRITGANGFSRGLLVPLAAGLLAWIAARLTRDFIPGNAAVRFFGGAAAGAVTYLATVFIGGLSASERAIVDEGIAKARKALKR